jgi:hypothetical protein
MRPSTIVAAACMTCVVARAHADDLGLRGDFDAGIEIGGARIHDQGGMLSGGSLAAGVSWHELSLVGTYERDGFIASDGDPSVSVSRLGWRARYDLELNDDKLGRDGVRSKISWYFDAGTGEQLIRWEVLDSHRADFSVGTGLSMLGYDGRRDGMPLGMGLDIGFEMTSAAALPAVGPAGEVARTATMAASTSGRENAYMFTFAARFF